jgi:hypothetical protein
VAAGSDRSRRIRDTVEAALPDILLLGTDEQVRVAARAAIELAEGAVRTAELMVSLCDFIRRVWGLPPIPAGLALSGPGPTWPSAAKGRGEGGGKVGQDRGIGRGMGVLAAGGGRRRRGAQGTGRGGCASLLVNRPIRRSGPPSAIVA